MKRLKHLNSGGALASAEAKATSKRLGVWEGNDQKPWDYRKTQQ